VGNFSTNGADATAKVVVGRPETPGSAKRLGAASRHVVTN